jgi:hypothetical protein
MSMLDLAGRSPTDRSGHGRIKAVPQDDPSDAIEQSVQTQGQRSQNACVGEEEKDDDRAVDTDTEDEGEEEEDDDEGDGEDDSDDDSSTRSFPVAKTPMNSLVSLVEEKDDPGHKDAEWYSKGKQPEQLASVREVEEEDYMDIEDAWSRGHGYQQEPSRSARRPSYPPADISSVPRMPYSPATSGAFEVPRGSLGGSSTGLSAGTASTAGRTMSSLHSQAALLFSRRNKKATSGTNKDLGNLFDLTSNRSHHSRRPKNGLPTPEPLRFFRPDGNNGGPDRIDLDRDVERNADPFSDIGAIPKNFQDPSAGLGTHSQDSSDNKSYTEPAPSAVLESSGQKERDQRRLEQLGYSQDLGRDYGFWASFSVGFCNIGGLQGSLFGIFTTFSYGGPQ